MHSLPNLKMLSCVWTTSGRLEKLLRPVGWFIWTENWLEEDLDKDALGMNFIQLIQLAP